MRDALGRSPHSAASSTAIAVNVQLKVGLRERDCSHLKGRVAIDRRRDIACIYRHMYSYWYWG
eukprot:2437212-Heterocapsa_arctica.AAC.1